MGRNKAQRILEKIRRFLRLDKIPPLPRKILVGVLGGLCLIAGVVMIVMPGPAFVFLPLGLLLLAMEFPWARIVARKLEGFARRSWAKWRAWRARHALSTSKR